jgi:DnaK suppressor protein
MNATVTRSTAKKSAAKSSIVKTKTPTKSASKSVAKTAPAKSTRTASTVTKKTAAAKAAPKKEQAAPKKTPAVKPAARSAGTKSAAPGTKAKPAAKASSGTAAVKEASSGAHVSDNKAGPDLQDRIEQPAVSKVSEVATKTTKATQEVPANGALLTEEQILKMSEKDYMNEAQLAFFKARLQQLEKELLKNADETTEHLRETVVVPDPADRATIEEEHALELRTRDRERKLLKKVQQSLQSIETGDYGWCEETGEPIGVPRLLARPTATLSLEAQQRRELKQKMYGD